jgi:hypothetical protein
MRDIAIRNIHPNVTVISSKTDACDKNGNAVELDESKITTEVARLEAEFTANEYSRNRAEAYDSVGNQLDMMMKDMRDGTTTHQAACEAVKAKYPKPA